MPLLPTQSSRSVQEERSIFGTKTKDLKPKGNRLLWIASYPKSGNTWMRAFIANLIADKKEPLPLDDVGRYCPSEANYYWYTPFLGGKHISDFTDAEILKFRPLVQRAMLERSPNNLPLKTHSQFAIVNDVPLIEVNISMAVIYIIRDPRDVVLSGIHHFDLSIDKMIDFMNNNYAYNISTEGMVREWLGDWNHHVLSWVDLFPKKKIILRYEDLLAEPARNFSMIAENLGITSDKKRIDKAIEFSSFKKMKANEAKKGFLERPEHVATFFRTGKSGEWADKLSKKQIAKIEKNHGAIMQRFGYQLIS